MDTRALGLTLPRVPTDVKTSTEGVPSVIPHASLDGVRVAVMPLGACAKRRLTLPIDARVGGAT
jgi:hypothetical protein